jgi:hypothetical protein
VPMSARRLVRLFVLAQVGRVSSGMAARRLASSDRVSCAVGSGGSCGWVEGGHTPLQVALCATFGGFRPSDPNAACRAARLPGRETCKGVCPPTALAYGLLEPAFPRADEASHARAPEHSKPGRRRQLAGCNRERLADEPALSPPTLGVHPDLGHTIYQLSRGDRVSCCRSYEASSERVRRAALPRELCRPGPHDLPAEQG